MLAPVALEGPPDDHAPLPRLRHAQDTCRQPAEHDNAASDDAGGVRAGTVERRPDELRSDGVRGDLPRSGDDVAARDRPGVDVQPVLTRVAADEAFRER